MNQLQIELQEVSFLRRTDLSWDLIDGWWECLRKRVVKVLIIAIAPGQAGAWLV